MNRPRGGERGASDMSRARCTRSLAEICGTCRRVSGLCPAGVPVDVSRCRSLESQRVPFGPNRRTGGISFRSPRRRSGLTGPTASPPSTLFSRRPGLIGNSSWNAATARDSGRGRWCSVGVDGPRIPLARQLTEPRPRSRVLGLVVAVSRFARLPQRRSPSPQIRIRTHALRSSIGSGCSDLLVASRHRRGAAVVGDPSGDAVGCGLGARMGPVRRRPSRSSTARPVRSSAAGTRHRHGWRR